MDLNIYADMRNCAEEKTYKILQFQFIGCTFRLLHIHVYVFQM